MILDSRGAYTEPSGGPRRRSVEGAAAQPGPAPWRRRRFLIAGPAAGDQAAAPHAPHAPHLRGAADVAHAPHAPHLCCAVDAVRALQG
eukprot:9631600-Alexandrium_andersonii.AAC.1